MITATPSANVAYAQASRRRPSNGLLAVLTVLITLAAVGGIATHEFVAWDDTYLLANNPRFNPPTWSSVLAYLLPKNAELDFYIPLTEIAWGGLAYIARMDQPDADGSLLNPWVFHVASLLVHLLSTGVVFAILRHLFARESPDDNPWPAWIGTMIFAVHPVQVEAVAWACGMKDLLASLFTFICIYCFVRFRESRAGKRWGWFTLASTCLVLANSSKPGAVAIPLTVITIDVLLLGTHLLGSLRLLWWWFVLMIPVVLVTRSVQPAVWADPTPLLLRPLIAADALAFYIGKLLWPAALTFDYGRTPQAALLHGWPYWDWIVPASLGTLLFWKARRQTLPWTAVSIAVIGLLPVLGFIPFISQNYSTVSDHYLYPAMLGIALLIAWHMTRFPSVRMYTLAFIVIAALAIQSSRIAAVWTNSESLFAHAIERNRGSWIAYSGLAGVVARQGDLDGAERDYRIAVQINPRYGMTHLDFANLLLRKGDAAGALREFQALLDVYRMQRNFTPSLAAKAQLAIGSLLLRNAQPAAAAVALEESLRLDVNQPVAKALLAKARAAASQPTTHRADAS